MYIFKNTNVLKGMAVVALALLFPSFASAQLQVTAGAALNMTPEQLVQQVLVGEGVTVENVRFNGSAGNINCTSIGTFSTGTSGTNLGLASGIIMGSGNVTFAVGPNSQGGGSLAGCPHYNNAVLASAASGTINDCAVLEFDFYPKSDSIKFNYIFASEEYPEYVCGTVNDIFAFFISGLNPEGGSYNNYNIAIIPGTDSMPVSINTVNGGSAGSSGGTPCVLTNSAYYVSNTQQSIQYDGFTTVLTAKAAVIPCTPYHLVMAIADVGDNVWDSGVFLEANSLSSNAISFEFENPANPQNPSDLYEGCMAVIHMSRPEASPDATYMTVGFSGTASNGVDFEQKDVSFAFPAGVTELNYTIIPYMDGEIEGVETSVITFNTYELCPSDTVQFSIFDVDPLTCKIERDTLHSAVQSIQLNANVHGGMPNRRVEWRNLSDGQVRTGESIIVSTLADTRWRLFVEDSCGNNNADTMLIGIRHHFGFQCPDTTVCATEPVDLYVRGSSAVPVDSCVWYVAGQAPFEYENDTVRVYPDETTIYYVRSYTHWNGQIWEDFDSIRVLVIPLPETHVAASRERICEGESTTLTGSGAYKYSFDGGTTFDVATQHTFMPDTTTMITVYGLANGAECYGKDSVLIVVDTIPDIAIEGDAGVCGGEDAELTVAVEAESFAWSSQPADPTLGGQETNRHIIVNPASTTVYTVLAANGVCTSSESATVAVEPMPVAIGEVTPRTVSLGEMEAVFTDKSQYSTTRKWEFPDGVESDEREVTFLVPDDVDSVSVRLWAYNPYMCFDTTTVTVYVDHTTLWAPNAFTPDESTNNTFLVKMNDVQRYHIFIYNRQGVLVYESYDPEKPWDGTGQNGQKCPQGVYTYLISCHKITYPYDQIVRKGTVLLVR